MILAGFAATGHPPGPGDLAAASRSGHDLEALLAELHHHDVIRLDEQGDIQAAYPFSGVRTAHVVAIDGGPAVYAMCAIDALGMSAMLGRGVSITSRDPVSGQDIFVTVHDGQTVWEPRQRWCSSAPKPRPLRRAPDAVRRKTPRAWSRQPTGAAVS